MPARLLLLLLLLLLLPLAAPALAAPGLIFNGPAPPPDLGPPGAAHANRDRAHLKVEVCAIVGAYLGFVLVLGICLLTFGRKMRRAAQETPKSLDIELLKADVPRYADPSPVETPRSARSWLARHAFRRSKGSFHSNQPTSPLSPGGESISSFDQAVIDADKERRQREMERLYAAVMEHDAQQARLMAEGKSPTKLSTAPVLSPPAPLSASSSPASKRPPRLLTKKSFDSRYGSHYGSNPASPVSPKSPVRAIYPPVDGGQPSAPASPLSIISRHNSAKSRRGIRNLRISAPIQKYPGDNDEEAQTPLSPRAPTTPATFDGDFGDERMDQARPLPMASPQRGLYHPNNSTVPTLGLPAPGVKSATSSTSTLPLRMLDETTGTAAPVTKTTYVDRRLDKLSLRTPRTGVPMTPYSPYMPFTPVTPVTPHLQTKRERKQMQKAMGRKVPTQDDQVQDSKDMWDSAY